MCLSHISYAKSLLHYTVCNVRLKVGWIIKFPKSDFDAKSFNFRLPIEIWQEFTYKKNTKKHKLGKDGNRNLRFNQIKTAKLQS